MKDEPNISRAAAARLRSETASALRGYSVVPGHTEVIIPYRGLGRVLCAVGVHDLVSSTLGNDALCTERTEYHCLRCGRLCAVIRSVWENDGPEGDEDGGDGSGFPQIPAGDVKVA